MALLLCATAAVFPIISVCDDLGEEASRFLKVKEIFSLDGTLYRRPAWPPAFEITNYTKPIKVKGCSKNETGCEVIRKWDNKSVPYEFADNMEDSLKKAINETIVRWNKMFEGCIEFSERTSEKDYIQFFESTSCYSSIGKLGGEQQIVLEKEDCSAYEKIVHEMMHSIGLLHEHTRPDRDDYVQVLFDKIPPDWISDYMKFEDFHFEKLRSIPYDYYSIMHYTILGPDKRTPVLKILKENVDYEKVGQSKDLTLNDIMKVKSLYC